MLRTVRNSVSEIKHKLYLFVKYFINILFLERRRMASKKVKELKTKDLIYSAFLENKKAHSGWAIVDSVNKLRVYDTGKMQFRFIHELVIKPISGVLKEEPFKILLDENDLVKVPPKPNKFQKIWRAIFY